MITSIIIFILVLSVLIIFHETGHFFAARKAGIWVEEFGFGLPPRVFGRKIGETIYSINLLPFGGFVRLHGENTEEQIEKPKRAFLNKNKKTRAAIVCAGVFMNAILAVICFAIVYSFSGIPRQTDNVIIVDVSAGSPSQAAGVLVGDTVKKVDKLEVTNSKDFINFISEKKGKKTTVEIDRGGQTKKIVVIPRVDYPDGEGPLGVTISNIEVYYPPIWERPFYGVYYGFKDALFWGKTIIVGLYDVIRELFGGHIPKAVSGPVGIFAITTEAAKLGILSLINFVGILSVNLAILNIVPFPALDGGRLLFIVLEKLIGRKVIPKVEATIHTFGMVVLLLLLVAITVADIKRLIVAGSISGFIDSVLK